MWFVTPLGFFWKNSDWIDYFLLFGLWTSLIIFDSFAKDLHWILLNLRWKEILHYLNNFWSIYPTIPEHIFYASLFNNVCNNIKLRFQGTKVDFLKIELDIISMEAWFPPDKLQKAIKRVKATVTKTFILIKNLQSQIGFQVFACKVLPFEKTFLRRFLDALRMIQASKRWITVV